jgi:transcriptional regulator with XRE-family HTH domain
MNALQEFRTSLGLSQKQMADLLDITKSQLGMYEIGQRVLPDNARELWNAIEKQLAATNTDGTGRPEADMPQEERDEWTQERKAARILLGNLQRKREQLDQREAGLLKLLSTQTILAQSDVWKLSEDGKEYWELLIRKAGKERKKLSTRKRPILLKERETLARIAQLDEWLGA